ncbi:MAG: hypothetical protein GY749_13905 [Desulfobacteraceae bacterium]|nr:hypothetical protein [Desulfobacteraceae bacterium]
MKKIPFYLSVILVFSIFTGIGWALDISPKDTTGKPGDSVVVQIYISDIGSGLDINAFSFIILFDENVLTYVEVDKTETLTESFSIVDGKLQESGKLKVNGVLFTGELHIDSEGLFLKIKFTVNTTANKDSVLSLLDFKDDIAPAVTTDATFKLITDTYKINKTVSPSSCGTITASPDKTSYSSDELVELKAIPDSCYEFTGWSGACSSTSPTCNLTMDSDKSVTANFKIKTYSQQATLT